MAEMGLTKSSGSGTFFILPLLQRSVEKLEKILDKYMQEIDGQKITMPTLTELELWKKTGRYDETKTELMVLQDRHDKMHLLSPVRDHLHIDSYIQF